MLGVQDNLKDLKDVPIFDTSPSVCSGLMYSTVPIFAADEFVTVEFAFCSWVQGQGLCQSSTKL